MAGEPQVSNPVDPLHAFSGISLIPRSIRASPDAPLPSDPNDLDSLHNFMKSVESSSPERALDEAKVILDKGAELLNSKFGEFLEALGIDKDVVAIEGKEKPQQRREGLGRKRPRFSLKPVTSQASEDLETSINIDQLQDPTDFFSAYEKLENAKREVQIQKGEAAPHSTNYYPSMNKRTRRPGILGKTASYTHRYSSAVPEGDDMHMSSLELLGDGLHSQSYDELQEKTNPPDSKIQEIDMEGSIVETENKVNQILDELLSKDNEDLDGDGALSFLQERLHIKPIDIGNLSVPDFHDIGRTDFKALAERLPRTRKALSNIGNLAKELTGGMPKKLKHQIECPSNSIASPTPPRSPFASSQSNMQWDPFSPLNVDLAEPRNSYAGMDIEEDSRQVSVLNQPSMSGNLRLDIEGDDCRPQVCDVDIQRVRHVRLTDSPLDKDIDQVVTDAGGSPHRSQSDMLDQRSDINLHGKATVCDVSKGKEDDSERNVSDKLTDNVGDALKVSALGGGAFPNTEDTAKSGSSLDVYQSSQVAGNLEEMHSQEGFTAHQVAKIQESANMSTLTENQPLANEVMLVAAEDNHVNMSSTIGEVGAGQNLQEQSKTKRRRGPWRESKAHPLRPSLAAAGRTFESGLRRSKRIKTRPLEYWKGERLLYGRVNDSLKLIGLKYISPAKGGGKLKLKSYVPVEYNEILEQAAAH